MQQLVDVTPLDDAYPVEDALAVDLKLCIRGENLIIMFIKPVVVYMGWGLRS